MRQPVDQYPSVSPLHFGPQPLWAHAGWDQWGMIATRTHIATTPAIQQSPTAKFLLGSRRGCSRTPSSSSQSTESPSPVPACSWRRSAASCILPDMYNSAARGVLLAQGGGGSVSQGASWNSLTENQLHNLLQLRRAICALDAQRLAEDGQRDIERGFSGPLLYRLHSAACALPWKLPLGRGCWGVLTVTKTSPAQTAAALHVWAVL